jgi:hypothetical protein
MAGKNESAPRTLKLSSSQFEVSDKELEDYVKAMKPAADSLGVTPEHLLNYCMWTVVRFKEQGRSKIDVEAIMEIINDLTDKDVRTIVNTGDGSDTH